MTPKKFIDLVRWRGNVNTSAPWADADLLPNVLHTIDDMFQSIAQVNPDYFEDDATPTTYVTTQEVTKPDDLAIFKRMDVSYTDSQPESFYEARLVTLAQLNNGKGEAWYAKNQPYSNPLVRFADTGFRLLPDPQYTPNAKAYVRVFYIPHRPDITDLTNDTDDIEKITGIGSIFHEPMVDMVVNQIRKKKGELTALEVQELNAEIKDMIDPSAYRVLSTFKGDLPSDSHLQY